jgi:hypothetical protein
MPNPYDFIEAKAPYPKIDFFNNPWRLGTRRNID